MKQKFIFWILCISVLLSAGITASAEVSEIHSDWAKESLISADELGLLPDFFSNSDLISNICRVDFCQLAYKMLETKELISEEKTESEETNKVFFLDTTDKYVTALANAGIINGRSATEFAPDDYITREEAAVILTNTAEFMGVKKDITLLDTNFSDFDIVSDWAKESVRKMDALAIMKGVGENNFSPKSNYTMEQAAITILKLFNLDLNDYKDNVEEIKVDGNVTLFNSGNKQWIKNKGKLVFEYEGPTEVTVDIDRSFVFFEKEGKWYFYVQNNCFDERYGYNVCSDIYNAETGNVDYELFADNICIDDSDADEPDSIKFSDDYYMVTNYYRVGGEGTYLSIVKDVYSYEGEKIDESHYSEYGDYDAEEDILDDSKYPCNNRQKRIDLEVAYSPSGIYFVQGKNLALESPYEVFEYRRWSGGRTWGEYMSCNDTYILQGYTPVKLSMNDSEEESYAIFDYEGKMIYKSNKKPYVLPYENRICIGENNGRVIDLYDIETREHIVSLDWEESGNYTQVDAFISDIIEENMKSECASPRGSYIVNGFNMLLNEYTYTDEFVEFLNAEGFGGYTPVCEYKRDDAGGHYKYYIYNPEGEVFLEDENKMYLMKYDDKVCYSRLLRSSEGELHMDIYSLETGETMYSGTIFGSYNNLNHYLIMQ